MKYEKLQLKELSYITTFGTLWGACEISLGMILHNFHIPLTGLVLTFMGAIISLVCVRITNRKRAIIYTAVIAAVIKMLSITTIKLGPFISIIVSAIMAQIVVCCLNISLLSFIMAAGLMCCWPFIYVLLTQAIIYTPKVFEIYSDFLHYIGLKNLKLSIIILTIMMIHFLTGNVAGIISWNISSKLLKRIKYAKKTIKT